MKSALGKPDQYITVALMKVQSLVGCGGENVSLVVGPSWSYHHFSFVGEMTRVLYLWWLVMLCWLIRFHPNSCDLPAVGKEGSPLA